jgi:hypothetical protein
VGGDLPPRWRRAEQRWFHLQEDGSDDRMLFEIRVIDGKWCLDSYVPQSDASQALLNRDRLHPLGVWYHVAAVYDGREFRNYVNGVQEGAAEIRVTPQRPGRSSVGVRFNKVNYFKGAIHAARFTRRALTPAEFPGGGQPAADQSGRERVREPLRVRATAPTATAANSVRRSRRRVASRTDEELQAVIRQGLTGRRHAGLCDVERDGNQRSDSASALASSAVRFGSGARGGLARRRRRGRGPGPESRRR